MLAGRQVQSIGGGSRHAGASRGVARVAAVRCSATHEEASTSSAAPKPSSDSGDATSGVRGFSLASPGVRGALGAVCASVVVVPGVSTALLTAGGNQPPGSGGDGNGGGGGGGDGGWGGSQPLYDLAADEPKKDESESDDPTTEEAPPAKEVGDESWKDLVTPSDEVEEVAGQRQGTNRCVEVLIEGWPEVGSLPKLKDLKDMLNVQEGHIFDYQDIVDDRRKLEMQYDEYIASVDIQTEFVDGKSNHQRVTYKVTPYVFSGLDTIQIKGATLMPQKAVDSIIKSCLPEHPYRVDIGVMDKVREKIEKWYQDRGLPFCYVGYFDGMEEGTMRANVIEAKINDVSVKYERANLGAEDTEYEYYADGKIVPAERIIAASGFKKGEHYHIDDGYDAMNSVYACGLLEDINIEPEQDMADPSKINIKIKVDEIEPRSMEMDLDWTIQTKNGLPCFNRQSLIPGGSVEISHENLFGDSQSMTVSLSSSDWRNPAQDLGVQVSYTEPFYAPNTTRNVQLFNTRKMSPVFTSPTENEVPPVFVDRLGLKGWTSHCGGQDNKVEHALLLQRINTCDENGQTVTKGTKVARGYYADNGPPTTLSNTGNDISLSYQNFTALDNVQFVNGNQLGRRALVQIDQGLNVRVPLPGGKAFGPTGGLYNRVLASYTKFMQLPFLPRLTEDDVWIDRKAPNTLVLHARAGNCVGDLASYDFFSLGGPYSVRGYSYGELGACRRFLETAAEVRVPLKNLHSGLSGTAYAFAERGTDLGSSSVVEGNPTEYYRKAGSGTSVGVGLKLLGACRFEYARDCNAGKNSMLVNWGERAADIMTKQPGMEDQAEGTTQTSKVPRLQEQQAMQEQQAVIHELPPACVAAIYQFMQPRDIMCCEAVAVSWREAGQVPWRPCDPEWMEDVPAWVAARWSTSLRLMCKVKVDASQYTDEQISGLAHLSELRTLEIDGRGRSPITSAGIQRLVEACPNISELALFILPLVGNSCIPAIGRLQQLGKLRMDFTDVNKGGLAVDNRSLKAMGKCTSLWSLIIVDIIVDFGGWNHWDSTCRVKVETFEIIADNFPNLRAFLDMLVDRLDRANATEESEYEEGEGGQGSLDRMFVLEYVGLTGTAWTEAGGHMEPGPNVLALRDASVYVK
ncbi:hypothetical protein FOA52_001893 [Chlamydomonas sp. UWO 241]|nr:hypothetical protein FOA52_001893 [Chlamydomonas sp. UWO 241]